MIHGMQRCIPAMWEERFHKLFNLSFLLPKGFCSLYSLCIVSNLGRGKTHKLSWYVRAKHMTTAGLKHCLGPEWSVRADVQGWGCCVPGLRAGSQVTEAFKYLLINVFICVFVKPKAGALLTPCQVDSGRGRSFQVIASRTVKLGKFTLGKEMIPFFSALSLLLYFSFLCLFLPLFSLKGYHGAIYPMLLQKAGTGPGAGHYMEGTFDSIEVTGF